MQLGDFFPHQETREEKNYGARADRRNVLEAGGHFGCLLRKREAIKHDKGRKGRRRGIGKKQNWRGKQDRREGKTGKNVPVDVWKAADSAGAVAEEPETARADTERA